MSELALVEPERGTLDVAYWGDVLVFASRMADAVADTEFVPGALRGRREAVAATIVYGVEVGLTPMQALAGIHIVDGRPAPSAELMRALILRAGHTFHVVEMTGTRARVWGQRKGRPDSERAVVEWTADMARAAGLLGRQNWQRYPRAMLVARATGDLARVLFPDVIKGLGYVAEDNPEALDAWVPDGGGPEVEAPARKPLQRRKRTPRNTPVQEVAAPVLAPVEPIPEPPDAPRTWLTDEETDAAYLAEQAEAARAAAADLASEEPPSSPPPNVSELDEPLPDDLQPVGTGRPIPRGDPVPTPVPDPEPEAPDDEVATPGVVRIAAAPLKALHTGLGRELGSVATREEKHKLVEAILGKPVESTKELTRADGYRVLAALDYFKTGEMRWEFTDGGANIRVLDTREPPEET